MRKFRSFAAIGLLAAGLVGLFLSAADDRAGFDSRLLFGPSRESIARLNQNIQAKNEQQKLAEYTAQVQHLQLMERIEKRNREATARFGQWGPYLVEAAETYGQDPSVLYRVMSCESKGDPYADNGINKGLFQFHPSTWASTPYGGTSIYDGEAQIMAAAWMWSQGRKGEWACV